MSSSSSTSQEEAVAIELDCVEAHDDSGEFKKQIETEGGAVVEELKCLDTNTEKWKHAKAEYKVHKGRRHCVLIVRSKIMKCFRSELFKKAALILLLLIVLIYLAFAFYRDFKQAAVLLIIFLTVALYKAISWAKQKKCYQNSFSKVEELAAHHGLRKKWSFFKCIVLTVSWLGVLTCVVISAASSPRNLVSLSGLLFLLLFSLFISQNPAKVSLRIVLCGLNLQFLMALLITRTSFGSAVFESLSQGVHLMLQFSKAGSSFIFGPLEQGLIGNGTSIGVVNNYEYFVFAIHALPVIVVYCSLANVLYHFGIMQAVIKFISHFMIETMGTSAPETLNAAANIFLGQTEAPLLIKPLLPTLTSSELHAVMTGGFATVAGAVLAVYSGMGIDSSFLIAASVMNAPAALVFSKIVYPETKSKEEIEQREQNMEVVKFRNVFVAAAKGASDSVMFVLNVTMNLIAFVSLCEMVNYILKWSGSLVGVDQLSFPLISSYLFYPLAFMIGVDGADCFVVAELIGIKTTVNELVAYEKLSGIQGLSDRSRTLATFALCGFANFASLGIQIGGIGALVPSRIEELSVLGLSALLCGSFACFSNACIIGLLY